MNKPIGVIAAAFATGAVFGGALLLNTSSDAAGSTSCMSTHEQREALSSLRWIAAQDTTARQATAYPALRAAAMRAQQTLDSITTNC